MAKLEKFSIKGAPTCRVVYPDALFEMSKPKDAEEGNPSFNCNIYIPKSDSAKVTQIMGMLDEAWKELKAKGYDGKTIDALDQKNICIIDGDAIADKKEGKEHLRGWKILKTKTYFRPLVVDSGKLTITNGKNIPGLPVEKMSPLTLNDGDYVVPNIQMWTTAAPYPTIGCNINAIMKFADGERLSGVSMDSDNYFDDVDSYK